MAQTREQAIIDVIMNGTSASRSIKEMQADVRKYTAEWRKAETAQDKALALDKVARAKAEVNKHNHAVRELTMSYEGLDKKTTMLGRAGSGFSKLANGFNKYLNVALAAIAAITGVTFALKSQLQYTAQLDDAYADVMKNTQMLRKEVEQLDENLGKLNTRTSRMQLLELASVAGKLGIKGVENITSFVRAADKIHVALGEDLGEDAIKNIGKLNEIFGTNAELGYEEAMLKTGSAINALGANSAAAEGFIVELGKRLGGIGLQSKMTIPEILGIASALDNLGLQGEMSATAVQQFLGKMFEDTAEFAEVAGMQLSDFEALLGEDVNQAFITVLKGIRGAGTGMFEMTQNLQKLGIDGARGKAVIEALAAKTELLVQQQALSNDEYQKGTSIIDEFNIKNNNAAALLEKIGKNLRARFTRLFDNETVMKFATSIASLLGLNKKLSESLEEERMELRKLELQVLTTNTSHEDRVKIIKEMQQKYPEYLGNIDAETISNAELSTALKGVNDQLINKIILAKEDEKISKQNERIAKARIKLIEAEDRLDERVINEAERNNIKLDQEMTREERSIMVLDKLKEKRRGRSEGGILFSSAAKLSHELRQYQDARQAVESRENAGNLLIDEKNALMKRLGITIDENTKKTTNSGLNSINWYGLSLAELKKYADGADATLKLQAETEIGRRNTLSEDQKKDLEKQIKARKDAYDAMVKSAQQFHQDISNLQREMEIKRMPLDEQEVATVRDKYAKLMLQASEFNGKLVGNDRQYAVDTAHIQAALQQEITAIRDKQFKERTEKELKESEKHLTKYYAQEKLQLTTALAEKKITRAQYEDAVRQLELQQLNTRLVQAKDYKQDTVDIEQAIADKQVEINEAKNDAIKDSDKKRFEAQKRMLEEMANASVAVIENIQQIYINKNQAQTNDELRELENRKNNELSNKEQTAAQRQKIEERYAKEEAALKLKQWEFEKQQAITMIAIRGALAIAQDLFMIPPNIPKAIFDAALMATQIAAVESQPAPVFYKGGFTKRAGSDSEVAGITHSNEYVISAWQLRQPQVFQFAEALEAQKRGYQSGGFTNIPSTTNNTTTTNNYVTDPSAGNEKIKIVLEKVLYRLEHPVAPNLVIGHREAYDLMELQEENTAIESAQRL